jgi:DNA helicase-2/ATP-dependent DNA helicase PcrA
MIDYKNELNKQQYDAVIQTGNPLLVLAGAGTGKTRVITYRIAYLINELDVQPENILAVTFTNKAAEEMKNRLRNIVGAPAYSVWMGTFHSISLRLLRRDGHIVGLKTGFGVIDQDDRLSLFREVIKALNIDYKKYPPKQYLNKISSFKNTPAYVDGGTPDPNSFHKMDEVFREYNRRLEEQFLIDFDDMLSFTIRMLKNSPETREYYSELFQHILVDEYQDTNAIQFMFLRLLSGTDGNICVVGDDDQSIYGWRGADIRNILDFDRHFNNVNVVKLTENYRSTPSIIAKANTLISKNIMRRGKELSANLEDTGTVEHLALLNESGEADFVTKLIEKYYEEGIPYGEMAVLYRTNAQSRNFEVNLNKHGIPYKVVGGTAFYQRREIKDMLSYLRFFDNRYDTVSFARSLKAPLRGIGDTAIDKIRAYAAENAVSLMDALHAVFMTFSRGQGATFGEYIALMDSLAKLTKVSDQVNEVIEKTGYKMYITTHESEEEAKKRIENIHELYNSAIAFEETNPEGTLTDFLANTSLSSAVDEEAGDRVSLMTIHSAKGLEFDTVFLTGLENGLFPLHSGLDEPDIMEEERRLCYVGLTRAKKHLHVTCAEARIVYGKRSLGTRSYFLDEMGFEKPKPQFTAQPSANRHDRFAFAPRKAKPVSTSTPAPSKTGKKVHHEKFGDGIVVNISGAGTTEKADVFFKDAGGLKKILTSFLKFKD